MPPLGSTRQARNLSPGKPETGAICGLDGRFTLRSARLGNNGFDGKQVTHPPWLENPALRVTSLLGALADEMLGLNEASLEAMLANGTISEVNCDG